MRGTIIKRSQSSWTLVLDQGRDPRTGKRRQRWISVKGTKKDAEKELNKLTADPENFVARSKYTVGSWLAEWLTKTIQPSKRRRTFTTYSAAVAHLTTALGSIPLQALKTNDIERYVADKTKEMSPATVHLHRAVLSAAYRSAKKNGLVSRNPVTDVEGLPPVERSADVMRANVLDVDEARRLLVTAVEAGPRRSAFYTLAVDSGARLGELCGLMWTDIDLTTGRLSISRQLVSSLLVGDQLDTGPTKTGRSRTVDLGPETVTRLRALKAHQAAVLLRNRTTAHDFGLVFTQEPQDLYGPDARVGAPLQMKILGKDLGRLLKAAKVSKRISFHGLRHTSATLMLLNGENPKVVSERLGHKGVSITLDTYSHVLPTMGRDAATRLGALLHG